MSIAFNVNHKVFVKTFPPKQYRQYIIKENLIKINKINETIKQMYLIGDISVNASKHT